MKVEILCVGTELLLGDIINTNSAFLAKELATLGANVFHQSVVGDNPKRLKEYLKFALQNNDVVITTGGLGPTCDDLTKETVAEVFNRKMIQDDNTLKRIKEYFAQSGRKMTINNEKQALVPEGAIILENNNGTAPGMIIEDKENNKTLIMLPGPPREMQRMFKESVEPYISKRTGKTIVSSTIHIFGMGESAVEDKLKDLMNNLTNPTLAPYAKEGEVQLRVTAQSDNKENAKSMIQPIIDKVKEIIPNEYIYGIDIGNLQTALVALLNEKNMKIATAESCTGGLISKRITEVSGSSDVFECGICSYSENIKNKALCVDMDLINKYGVVSEEVAKAMANGVREFANSDIGISTTGVAGPTGGTDETPVGCIYVGVSTKEKCYAVRLNLARGKNDERELIRYLASSNALYMAITELKNM